MQATDRPLAFKEQYKEENEHEPETLNSQIKFQSNDGIMNARMITWSVGKKCLGVGNAEPSEIG